MATKRRRRSASSFSAPTWLACSDSNGKSWTRKAMRRTQARLRQLLKYDERVSEIWPGESPVHAERAHQIHRIVRKAVLVQACTRRSNQPSPARRSSEL